MVPSQTDRCQRGKAPVFREDGGIEIPLTRGQVAVVDSASYYMVNDRLWFAQWNPPTRSFYACSQLRPRIYMHRTVAEAPAGLYVDHINHDTLDNQLANLRIATRAQNMQNRLPRRGTVSGLKGVSLHRPTGKWVAFVCVGKRNRHLGYFDDRFDAARAYDSAARAEFGERAFTNEMAGLLSPGGNT